MSRATELEYLQWFYHNADFGPADGDVRAAMQEQFMNAHMTNLPEGYNLAQDGETVLDREEHL